jgi:integrase
MKITPELRLDRLAADGTAEIQLRIAWEGNRVRLGSGAVVLPEHWDEKTQLVRVVKGAPYDAVNRRLNRAREAAAEAQQLATKQGRKLPKEELTAAVKAALVLTPVAPVPTKAEQQATSFESLQRAWIAEQVNRPRGDAGKPMAKTTKAGMLATLQRFLDYEQARGVALNVETMDLAWYQDFRTYLLEELNQGVNTFGKHISRLKTFLTWVEGERDLPVHRHYRKFKAPSRRGRVDALSEKELQEIAALDFRDPATRAQLLALRVELGRSTGKHQDADSADAWVAHVELARDKFLECCYTGLRISDANRAAWQHVRGNLIVLDDTAKNENTVYIPFYDDDVFRPVELANRYEHRTPYDLLVPECYRANEFLRVVQRLVGLSRLKLTTKIGRKTFVTLKLYAGVPSRTIMQATGHKTEEAFNHYVGVDELKIVEEFMRKASRKRVA